MFVAMQVSASEAEIIGVKSQILEEGLTPFAHESEAELARILDFYGVRYEYEPHTFPILWNLDGAVVESFSPDFYLPELDLYLEITTLRQKLVRKKNRKLRRLRELYPDLTIKLFYARDFRALMLKYGKLAIAGAIKAGDIADLARLASSGAAANKAPFANAIADFYLTNPIARASLPDPPLCFAGNKTYAPPVTGKEPRFVPHSIQTMPCLPPA